MNYENILISQDSGIVTLTINRPQSLNALNEGTLDELDRFFSNALANYPGMIGVIITGSGEKAFVAGADISQFGLLDSTSGGHFSKKGQDIFFKIEQFPRPVIALVNGFALGGGCELAMSCHIRIATPNARFGQPEVNLGIIPGYGGTQRLVQLIGKGKALELMMTAEMISAEKAEQLGLVNYVLNSEEALSKAISLINTISSKGPNAIAGVINCVNAYFENNVDGFQREYEIFGTLVDADEAREGTSAFLEKRKANFRK